MDFYASYLWQEKSLFNHLYRSLDVFHQFAVNMCAEIESDKLLYVKLNQKKKLRSDSYIHLQDGINSDVNPQNISQVCILPATFTGGPQYMHKRAQDAMTYVRYNSTPGLFITFTCKPAWKEIENEFFPGQKAIDRHNRITRLFRLS